MIHSSAIIDPSARIAEDVTIGPWSIIGPDVEIGKGTWIGPHVVINGPTRIGEYNKIFQFASVGEVTQDKKYQGNRTFLEIGDHNIIRECCTINRSTNSDSFTRIGNDNLFMAYVHIAHDCQVANHAIFSNNASLAGHVIVEDYAILSGFSMVHQYCFIGKHSFVAAATPVGKDVLPYVMVAGAGHEAEACGLNLVGLRRREFSPETINNLKRAYKIIFRQGLTVQQAIEQITEMVPECPEVQLFIDALQRSERGIVR